MDEDGFDPDGSLARCARGKIVLGVRLILHVAPLDTLSLQVAQLSWYSIAILKAQGYKNGCAEYYGDCQSWNDVVGHGISLPDKQGTQQR